MAHRAVIPINLFHRRDSFRRHLHGILALVHRARLRRVGRRASSSRGGLFRFLLLLLRAGNTESGKQYRSQTNQSVAHHYLLAARIFLTPCFDLHPAGRAGFVTRILHPRTASGRKTFLSIGLVVTGCSGPSFDRFFSELSFALTPHPANSAPRKPPPPAAPPACTRPPSLPSPASPPPVSLLQEPQTAIHHAPVKSSASATSLPAAVC